MGVRFDVRPYDGVDAGQVRKLMRDVAGYDASVPTLTEAELAALAGHPASHGTSGWRVATTADGALVGAMLVQFIGTKRTELRLAVNPAWRRRGVGRALIEQVPPQKRLLIRSRESVGAARSFLTAFDFTERYRQVRLRARKVAVDALAVPRWASLEEDLGQDPERLAAALAQVHGEDAESDLPTLRATLTRPGARVIYLVTPQGDEGVCLLAASAQLKKAELRDDGHATVGVLEDVALSKAVRGKGLSRPLIRAGIAALVGDGYDVIEVAADKRRPAAVDLYLKEGFAVVDEDVFWMRRDDV